MLKIKKIVKSAKENKQLLYVIDSISSATDAQLIDC